MTLSIQDILMLRFVLAVLLVIGLGFIYRRTKFIDDEKYVHYPANEVIGESDHPENTFAVGTYSETPQLSFYQRTSRKKINNYVFMVDNKYKLEIALVDLGYVSVVNANYFFQDHSYSFEEQISFKLPEDFNEETVEVNKKGISYQFQFKDAISKEGLVKVKKTDVHLKLFNNGSFINVRFKHVQPSDGCVTYKRFGVISYKCYGGVASGTFQVEIIELGQAKYQIWQKLEQGSVTTAFDGFRASGFEWQWVWGMGAGVKDGKHVSINLGTINHISEDVLYVDNKIIKIRDIEYSLNQNATISEKLQFKSQQLKMNLQFTVKVSKHHYKDMGIFKVDMVKLQGYWNGQFTDSETSEVHKLQNFPGLLETANSIF